MSSKLLKAKHNGHFTFESVIDSWGTCSVKNITSGVPRAGQYCDIELHNISYQGKL